MYFCPGWRNSSVRCQHSRDGLQLLSRYSCSNHWIIPTHHRRSSCFIAFLGIGGSTREGSNFEGISNNRSLLALSSFSNQIKIASKSQSGNLAAFSDWLSLQLRLFYCIFSKNMHCLRLRCRLWSSYQNFDKCSSCS